MEQEQQPDAFVVTLKGGAGYEAPWVVVRGRTADEVLENVLRFADLMGFEAVKGAAAQFQSAKGVFEIVAEAFPGSQVTYEPAGYDAPAQAATGPAARQAPKTAGGYQPQSYQVPAGQSYEQSAPYQGDLNPVCATCGGPTTFKSGTGQKGPWSAYFCSNTRNLPKEQQHKPAWS